MNTDPTGTTDPTESMGRPSPRPTPAVRALRRLPRATFAAAVFALAALAVLVLVLVNPGDRLGPIQPANPPVGEELPAP